MGISPSSFLQPNLLRHYSSVHPMPTLLLVPCYHASHIAVMQLNALNMLCLCAHCFWFLLRTIFPWCFMSHFHYSSSLSNTHHSPTISRSFWLPFEIIVFHCPIRTNCQMKNIPFQFFIFQMFVLYQSELLQVVLLFQEQYKEEFCCFHQVNCS